MFKRSTLLTAFFLCMFSSQALFASSDEKQFASPILGRWRGVFKLRENVDVPFIFEVRKKVGNELGVFFINGKEQFDGGVVEIKGDSVFVRIDQFENMLALKLEGNDRLSGVLKKQNGSGTPTLLTAERGNKNRFLIDGEEPRQNISGTYQVVFKSPAGKIDTTVGVFNQLGAQLAATFLRITGDSRFLDGVVVGDRFYLSSFIGSGIAYYEGRFNTSGQIEGEQIGAKASTAFSGILKKDAALPDAYQLTMMKPGFSSFDFSFPDLAGRRVSLKDKQFENKAVVLTIGGSWCPNCMDEAAFLAPWYKENKNRGVEVVSIHYERSNDSVYAKKGMDRFKSRFGITYTQLFGGVADNNVVLSTLPALEKFIAFPTTIFLDRQKKVKAIHTGFSGPATGEFYESFKKEFNQHVEEILQ
ncbi:MAG: TlpA disulfide reductase family protein [bacterium]